MTAAEYGVLTDGVLTSDAMSKDEAVSVASDAENEVGKTYRVVRLLDTFKVSEVPASKKVERV